MKNIFMNINKVIKILSLTILIILIGKISSFEETKTINKNLNKTLDMHAMAEKIEEINYNDLYSPLDSFVGDLTGYGALCSKCSGFLGCNGMDVRDGKTSYIDNEYGEVKIVASSKKIKCGSIISFKLNKLSDKPIIAIVLDRGVSGTSIDLLTESENYAGDYIGRQQIKYDLLRSGWNKSKE